MVDILGYTASIITIISVYMAGNKSIWMWYLSILNQIIWFSIGILTQQYFLCVMAVFIEILNIRGVIKWLK